MLEHRDTSLRIFGPLKPRAPVREHPLLGSGALKWCGEVKRFASGHNGSARPSATARDYCVGLFCGQSRQARNRRQYLSSASSVVRHRRDTRRALRERSEIEQLPNRKHRHNCFSARGVVKVRRLLENCGPLSAIGFDRQTLQCVRYRTML